MKVSVPREKMIDYRQPITDEHESVSCLLCAVSRLKRCSRENCKDVLDCSGRCRSCCILAAWCLAKRDLNIVTLGAAVWLVALTIPPARQRL